jgi:hypothetical protein
MTTHAVMHIITIDMKVDVLVTIAVRITLAVC